MSRERPAWRHRPLSDQGLCRWYAGFRQELHGARRFHARMPEAAGNQNPPSLRRCAQKTRW